ncbi:hydrogenase expression protein, partial [Halobium palmae]
MLASVPDDEDDEELDGLDREGIGAAEIGRVLEPGVDDDPREAGVALDGEFYTDPVDDGMYALWE